MNDNNDLFNFYNKILNELKIALFEDKPLLYLNEKVTDNNYVVTDNKKYILFPTSTYLDSRFKNKQNQVTFDPLTKYGNLHSLLVINDGIHTQLSKFVFIVFEHVLNVKFNNYNSTNCDKKYIFELPSGNKNTINKWDNIHRIIQSTRFAQNLITFSIDLEKYSQSILVNFTYPLYNYLNTIEHNTIFGIKLQNSEIELFKEIYQYYIIDPLYKLFEKPILIPDDSDNASKFYAYMETYLKIKEFLKTNILSLYLKMNLILQKK
jgi:hypothetical protein